LAEDRIRRLEQEMQNVVEIKQALKKAQQHQLEQIESQRAIEPAAKPTEPEQSPKDIT
jgi:hypothetical protein